MFQPNSRIENFKGVRFYEQDVLYNDYMFTEDIQITLTADCITPGIGIALINNEGLSIKDKHEGYLFRVGYKEASVLYRNEDTTKTLSFVSTNFAPLVENAKIIFTKSGRKITLQIDGYGTILNYELSGRLDKYNIGIYSNAGNIIKTIGIASSIPNFWNVNMRNTDGGYIKFLKDSFRVEDCLDDAELEQSQINIKAGKYFLKYTKEDINKDIPNDIVAYVFHSDDQRIYDNEKNILKDGSFEVNSDTTINLKFKGKNGVIKNIHISDKANDKYVSTRKEQITLNGSHMDILLDNIKEINWKGIVYDVPSEVDLSEEYAIVADEITKLSLSNLSMIPNKEYSFTFKTTSYALTVKDLSSLNEKTVPLYNINDKITIFKNVNAVITELTLKQKDGEEINFIVEKTSKKYVPANITSPIVALDQEDTPFNLSSSYRIVTENNIDKYIFTNFEREYFESKNKIRLTNKISKETGSIKLYGIPHDAKTNFKNILRIPKQGMDTIDMFCSDYDVFYEQHLLYFDKQTGDIYIEDHNKYSMIIVDYLKQDSYCVNYIQELNMYEVDISTQQDNTSLIYDSGGQDQVSTSSNYKLTNITPKESCYIALRRGGF